MNVGDKVVLIVDHPEGNIQLTRGMVGRIAVMDSDTYVGVDFEFEGGGLHNLHGRLETRSGWWCRPEEIRLITDGVSYEDYEL